MNIRHRYGSIAMSFVCSAFWVLVTWVNYEQLSNRSAAPAWRALAMGTLVVVLAANTLVAFLAFNRIAAPVAAPRATVPSRDAYLVVHLDLHHSPPVAKFACIYSCSGSDLTMTGAHEARLDLYKVTAPTFEEALNNMRLIAPLYFPWVVPLMRPPLKGILQ